MKNTAPALRSSAECLNLAIHFRDSARSMDATRYAAVNLHFLPAMRKYARQYVTLKSLGR